MESVIRGSLALRSFFRKKYNATMEIIHRKLIRPFLLQSCTACSTKGCEGQVRNIFYSLEKVELFPENSKKEKIKFCTECRKKNLLELFLENRTKSHNRFMMDVRVDDSYQWCVEYPRVTCFEVIINNEEKYGDVELNLHVVVDRSDEEKIIIFKIREDSIHFKYDDVHRCYSQFYRPLLTGRMYSEVFRIFMDGLLEYLFLSDSEEGTKEIRDIKVALESLIHDVHEKHRHYDSGGRSFIQ